MANSEHLAILKQGVRVWNAWRKENSDVRPDLSFAHLTETDLKGANLWGAMLDECKMQFVNLSNANLNQAYLFRSNLDQAILQGADLRNANLSEVILGESDLSDVKAEGVNLRYSDLSGGSYLSNADLRNADLADAILTCVDFTGANLVGANFSNADMYWADFTEATIGTTVFGGVHLENVQGLETVEHRFPSIIGLDTIYKSKGNIPEVFLRGAGVPEDFITFMRSLTGKAFEFYSCFISHSAKDKRFCERLYADLQAKDVRVWYFPENAKWGEPVWGEIDRSIKIYDKLVVVLSENSLQSGPVLREIERALIREDKEGKGILFPIRIDDCVIDTWEHERKVDVLRKVVGDFSGWDKNAAKYDKAFERLLKGLQAESDKT